MSNASQHVKSEISVQCWSVGANPLFYHSSLPLQHNVSYQFKHVYLWIFVLAVSEGGHWGGDKFLICEGGMFKLKLGGKWENCLVSLYCSLRRLWKHQKQTKVWHVRHDRDSPYMGPHSIVHINCKQRCGTLWARLSLWASIIQKSHERPSRSNWN